MLVFGLTGPTGAGQGAVSEVFASYGIPVINADEIYHRLLIPPSQCLNELTDHFGRTILTPAGTLDRRALAAIVFEDPSELEAITVFVNLITVFGKKIIVSFVCGLVER